MTPEEIGRIYARAAHRLREAKLFTHRPFQRGLRYYGHIFDPSRTRMSADAESFAMHIETLVDQVCGHVKHDAFQTPFVVNLEAFAKLRIREEENVLESRRKLALGYVPIRLAEFLKYTSRGLRKQFYKVEYQYEVGGGGIELFGLGVGVEFQGGGYGKGSSKLKKGNSRPVISFGMPGVALNRSASDMPRCPPIQQTSGGPRIRRRLGWVTSMFVLFVSSMPVTAYLVLRVGEADVEDIIQTALAIAAGTLLIVASPLHRILFNNWGISEALSGRMTLDEDTVGNITGIRDRREVGIGLVVRGDMELLSDEVGYAAPYSSTGLNPGPMFLSILTACQSHKLVVDVNGALVLVYGDGNAVQLVVKGRRGKESPLMAKRYQLTGHWYVLNVAGAEDFLVE